MENHSRDKQELLDSLGVDPSKGLSAAEAQKRLAEVGENKLAEKKKKSLFVRFLEQFKDVMIIILIVAAIISLVVACFGEDPMEFIEPALIFFIVIMNAVIGVLQENKAEKALEALKNMSAPHAKVIRDGKEAIISSTEVVPGDIIKLEAGDFVPADARLVDSANLKSEESALTGESVPSEKDSDAVVEDKAPIGDRRNMVFSGCSITYGRATAVVTGTGMKTEMGKIADLLAGEKEEATPLQQKLAKLGKWLGIVALAACAIVFVVGLIDSIPPLEIFMVAVSLAVSAIPEGLPAIITIVLSIGVTRMVKKNAIIKRLPAVETLGSASVICSDKTGTLTQNRMTLVKTYVDGGAVADLDVANLGDDVRRLLDYGALCCDGSVVIEGGKETHIGDPTETAIVLAATKAGDDKVKLNTAYPRVAEVKARVANDEMSREALRVLAVGYRVLDKLPEEATPETLEDKLTFIGLVGMIDPPRPEAAAAVAVCREAGIKPVMITGDHVVTAQAIAKQLDIFREGDMALTGPQLDEMSDEELDANIEHISVYARVSPENKIRIVKAWQKKGKVVSMTGDGVNDAPALKAADIGCAMGITGTDVAKGAADVTLTDDNFATIVDAVKEGRGIFANIKKVVGFLLSTNVSEILSVFIAMLIWRESPFISIQLLWINLVTDSLPAIALGMEAVEKDVMKHPPRPKDEGLFAHKFGLVIGLQGALFSILVLLSFYIGDNVMGHGIEGGSTLAFITLSLSQIVHAYNMRSDRSLFKIGPFSNRRMNIVALISVVLIAFVVFVPGVNGAFGMVYVEWWGYLIAVAFSFVSVIVMEIVKAFGIVKYGAD